MPSYFYDAVLDLVSGFLNTEGSRILDVGCGQGLLIKKLLKSFPNNEVYGIDFSRNLIKMAKASGGNWANLLFGDALRMPFRDGSFDLAICSEVVEHVVDPNLLFGSINSCLRKGGYALFTLPNVLAFYPLYAIFQNLPSNVKKKLPIIRTVLIPCEDPSKSIQPIDHAYASIELLKWLRKYGFEPLRLKGVEDEPPAHIFLAKLETLSRFHGRVSPLFGYRFLVITRKVDCPQPSKLA